jgi:catechol 2,3-dioxygenase-like lactoylglutathione lyase family enzyme
MPDEQEVAMAEAPKINGLYHFAWPCRDAEETRAFYEDLLGLPLVNFMESDTVPSTGEKMPYCHMFFEMGDGSYMGFFDLGKNEMPKPSPNTPEWVTHIALQVDSIDAVKAMKERLDAAGVETVGVVDHHFIQSVYFFDPNGLRLEITTRTEAEGFLEKTASEAHDGIARWNAAKARRLGAKSAA